jgi:signal transduction histidine kinase
MRLTLWFTGILFVSLLAMGALSYYEFVAEPRAESLRQTKDPKEESDENSAADVIGIVAWCGLPALVVGLGGGWWLMRKALAPVTSLTQAAERMNEHTLGRPLSRTGNGDELDRLTEVFNAMTERLNQSFARIREFTLHASHELKTPLTVMHGELETALQAETLPTSERERLESELDEVQRLTKIVDGLTLLTKADAGQIPLAREPVRLDELLREACLDAQSLARAQEIEIETATCEEVTLKGDRHRLRQLLLNLTDNAIKYNHRKGRVTLGLRRVEQTVELTITNTGPGIAAESLLKIFEPFYRADASHSNSVDGCGLGLSICRWIVTAHCGTIQIRSESGGLTTVVVRFPEALSPATK